MTATYDSLLTGTTSPGLFTWRGDLGRDLVTEARAAGWVAYDLDTRAVESRAHFHETLAEALGLPASYRRNLDGLFDALAALVTGPTLIVWDGVRGLAAVDPVEAAAVLDVLRDAVGLADTLAVVLRDDLDVSGFDGLL